MKPDLDTWTVLFLIGFGVAIGARSERVWAWYSIGAAVYVVHAVRASRPARWAAREALPHRRNSGGHRRGLPPRHRGADSRLDDMMEEP